MYFASTPSSSLNFLFTSESTPNFVIDYRSITNENTASSMVFYATSSETRVGINFKPNDKLLKAFEVKTEIDSVEGTELLIRSSRTDRGAFAGDEGGSINF